MKNQWQATASIEVLRKRAVIISLIRQFFADREVLEVETPSLSHHTITDPYLQALSTMHTLPGAESSRTFYLQTSPEYAMKRLLASGSGDIYQIAKAYRNDEVGRLHNPEFTMLEWYRVGFDMTALIEETVDLLKLCLQTDFVDKFTYSSLFEEHCGFNPIEISLQDLMRACNRFSLQDYAKTLKESLDDAGVDNNQSNDKRSELLKDSLLQVIFNQEIECKIGQQHPCVVSSFPASQASLATLSDCGRVANRFEVYYKGIELANGFHELCDADQQLARFKDDNQKRLSLGLAAMEIDSFFIDALAHGLPDCAGIALGIDRLLMLALDKPHIRDVLSFSYDNC